MLDLFFIRQLVSELSVALCGGRVRKVYQPLGLDLKIAIYQPTGAKTLYISANPDSARVHLTTQKQQNEAKPSNFCLFLRRHLQGGVISAVIQPNQDRVIAIDIHSRVGARRLVIELQGRRSNIILVNMDNGKVLDAVVRVHQHQNRVRTVLAGKPYLSPPLPPEWVSPFDYTEAVLREKLACALSAPIAAKRLMRLLPGVSPLLARNLTAAGQNTGEQVVASWLQSAVNQPDFTPDPVFWAVENSFYYRPLELLAESPVEHYPSLSELLDCVYGQQIFAAKLDRERTIAIGNVLRVKDQLERLIYNLSVGLERLAGMEQDRLCGQLLQDNLHALLRGMPSFSVQNYYDTGELVAIPMDPSLTPQQNSQRYFRQYKRTKASMVPLRKKSAQAQRRLAQLESWLVRLESCTENDQLVSVKLELVAAGFLRRFRTNATLVDRSDRELRRNRVRKRLLPGGYLVYIGLDNRGNDFMLRNLASPWDFWFHVVEYPGPHVILKWERKKAAPEERLLATVAAIAAAGTKIKAEATIQVDMTAVKFVKKIKGAGPGQVHYSRQRSLFAPGGSS